MTLTNKHALSVLCCKMPQYQSLMMGDTVLSSSTQRCQVS